MTWFLFIDTHTGGHAKTPWRMIAIEADCEDAARYRFEWLFGWTSWAESCDCCGEDYSVSISDGTLDQGPDRLILRADQEDLTWTQAARMDAFGSCRGHDWETRVENRAALAEVTTA